MDSINEKYNEQLSFAQNSYATGNYEACVMHICRNLLEFVLTYMKTSCGIAASTDSEGRPDIRPVAMIDALREKDYITESECELLHRCRQLGNKGVHVGESEYPVTESDASKALEYYAPQLMKLYTSFGKRNSSDIFRRVKKDLGYFDCRERSQFFGKWHHVSEKTECMTDSQLYELLEISRSEQSPDSVSAMLNIAVGFLDDGRQTILNLSDHMVYLKQYTSQKTDEDQLGYFDLRYYHWIWQASKRAVKFAEDGTEYNPGYLPNALLECLLYYFNISYTFDYPQRSTQVKLGGGKTCQIKKKNIDLVAYDLGYDLPSQSNPEDALMIEKIGSLLLKFIDNSGENCLCPFYRWYDKKAIQCLICACCAASEHTADKTPNSAAMNGCVFPESDAPLNYCQAFNAWPQECMTLGEADVISTVTKFNQEKDNARRRKEQAEKAVAEQKARAEKERLRQAKEAAERKARQEAEKAQEQERAKKEAERLKELWAAEARRREEEAQRSREAAKAAEQAEDERIRRRASQLLKLAVKLILAFVILKTTVSAVHTLTLKKVDVFDKVEIAYSGVSPVATAKIINNNSDSYLSSLTITPSQELECVANGDEIVLTLKYNAQQLRKNGMRIMDKDDHRQYVVSGLPEYVMDADSFTSDDIARMAEEFKFSVEAHNDRMNDYELMCEADPEYMLDYFLTSITYEANNEELKVEEMFLLKNRTNIDTSFFPFNKVYAIVSLPVKAEATERIYSDTKVVGKCDGLVYYLVEASGVYHDQNHVIVSDNTYTVLDTDRDMKTLENLITGTEYEDYTIEAVDMK